MLQCCKRSWHLEQFMVHKYASPTTKVQALKHCMCLPHCAKVATAMFKGLQEHTHCITTQQMLYSHLKWGGPPHHVAM
jgi:hypothetical protein